MEQAFDLFVDGVFFGLVWLTPLDLTDLEPVSRAVSGLARYRSRSNPRAVYRAR